MTGIIIALTALLILSGCRANQTAMPCEADARCLIYGITADIPILDPHITDSVEAGMVFRQIYDTLVYRDSETHEFLPGLANAWEVSADGLVYTFHLRQDVRFHDGTRFDAAAVARNIDRIFDAEINSLKARALLGPLSRYEILDDFTLRIILFEPYAPLLDGLAQPFLGMASPQALDAYDRLRYQFHQVGTGPFVLDSYLPGDRIALRRSADYAGAPIYAPRDGQEAQRIELVVLAQGSESEQALLAGTVDIIDSIPPAAAQNLSGSSSIQLLLTDIPGQTVQLLLNTARPPLSDPTLRQALLLATNRIAIIDTVFFNYSAVAWAPLSQRTGFSHRGYVNEFAFDIGAAQALLAQAGYADSDEDGILERAGEPLQLRMIVPPWGQLPAVAAFLKAQWRSIGIELSIEPVPGSERLLTRLRAGEYDLVPVENYGIDPAILGLVFLDSARYRFPDTQNPELNRLLLLAMGETDPQERRSQYYQIQAQIMSQNLILPIRENVRIRALRPTVQQLHYDAYGLYPLLANLRLDTG